MPVAPRGRLAFVLAVLALVVSAAAGCGGGGDDGKATTDAKTTADQKDGEPAKKKAPRGGVVKSFDIRVVSPTRATITATLTRASPLALQVRRLVGPDTRVKVGKIALGNKPAGRSTINWDLKADGKKLSPGRYRIVLRAGKTAGKSYPRVITVPSG